MFAWLTILADETIDLYTSFYISSTKLFDICIYERRSILTQIYPEKIKSR